jgi:hypothetical protein
LQDPDHGEMGGRAGARAGDAPGQRPNPAHRVWPWLYSTGNKGPGSLPTPVKAPPFLGKPLLPLQSFQILLSCGFWAHSHQSWPFIFLVLVSLLSHCPSSKPPQSSHLSNLVSPLSQQRCPLLFSWLLSLQKKWREKFGFL